MSRPDAPTIRVVHLADGALSGAPHRLAEVQRLGGLDARLIACEHAFGPRVYGRDVIAEESPERVAELLRAADVVHFHNWWRESFLFELYPWAWELVSRKPQVIQFHSPRFAQFEPALADPGLTKLVVAQYQVRLFPECLPVPNAVPIDDPLHRPLWRHNEPPVVAYTPPQVEDTSGWGSKGAAETLPVLRDFPHRFIVDSPWADAMRLRQECDVAIDEVVTGSYHMCSLEALSQGLATVAGLDAQTVDALERVTGTRQHPWIVATPETLRARLTELTLDADFRRAKREEARRYMERHWNAAALTAHFRAVYAAALERGAS